MDSGRRNCRGTRSYYCRDARLTHCARACYLMLTQYVVDCAGQAFTRVGSEPLLFVWLYKHLHPEPCGSCTVGFCLWMQRM